MRRFISAAMTAAVCVLAACTPREGVKFSFDSSKEVSGGKVALSRFCDTMPTDWSGYNYAVLELRSSTSQRVFLGFNTEQGYNELRMIFYATNGWIRTAIPLSYFRELPAGAFDLAATYNQKRPMSFINLEHGTRSPLVGVDSMGLRLHYPIGDPTIEIRSFSLAVEDPGDAYLGTEPAADRFGQWALGDFEGKARSLEQLRAEWAEEEAAVAAFDDSGRSPYGGDLSRKTRGATGFFRTELIDGRWWFVDPDGCLFLSLGANIVRHGAGTVFGVPEGVYEMVPPEGFVAAEPQGEVSGRRAAMMKSAVPLGAWNRYLRFGDEEADRKARELTVGRMKMWGMNTIGNWSDRSVIDMNRVPFMLSLSRLGIENGILGLADVYASDFVENNDRAVKASVEKYRDNPMLVGYFFGNEPAWCNHEERLCELILEADDAMPLKQAFVKYLGMRGDTPQHRREFVFETFRKFLSATTAALRKHDPNHLALGIRFGSGVPSREVLAACRDFFDVYSFNSYGIEPSLENMSEIYAETGLPMLIGEYHFGTADRGLGMSLIQVDSQRERGVAYRHYTERAFSHPALIGASYFQWNDQELFGRMDGENYNIGLVDVTDRPYKYMVEAVRAVADDCYEVHAGSREPYAHRLERVSVAGQLPDKWE